MKDKKSGKNLVPLGDRIVVKVAEAENRSLGGIIIPDTAKERPRCGKVIAVGPGKLLDDGSRLLMEVTEGDEVWFNTYAGSEFEIDGEKLLVMTHQEVMCKTHN